VAKRNNADEYNIRATIFGQKLFGGSTYAFFVLSR
jgi:hypothetical protein